MQIKSNRLMQSLEEMWQIGATPAGGVHRLALTDEDKAARDILRRWCEEAGLETRIDDFGNMIGTRAGAEDLPPVIIGSHLDTVPKGGRYDGVLGVLAGLEVIRTLNDMRAETQRPVAVINWTAEEGSRFRPPLFGSRGALGRMDAATAMNVQDVDGVRFGDELERIGYAGSAENRPSDGSAYLELHIEQGPILEAENLRVGLVQGIIGQTWFDIKVVGRPGHAGANPMHLRKDALVAAAALILEIRNLALACRQYGVATVGQIGVEPGAMNVVPGKAKISVDVRCSSAADMAMIRDGMFAKAQEIEKQEGVVITISESNGSPESQPFDSQIMSAIRDAIAEEGLPLRELWSGAGHDAGPASLHWPTGMIFVRSKDGLSHAEAEYSASEDIAAATNVLLRTTLALAEK